MKTMQFVEDTQVAGRLFPRGAILDVIDCQGVAIVPPDTASFNTIAAVPSHALMPIRRYRVTLANYHVGLTLTREELAVDADAALAQLATNAPNCDVISLVEIDAVR